MCFLVLWRVAPKKNRDTFRQEVDSTTQEQTSFQKKEIPPLTKNPTKMPFFSWESKGVSTTSPWFRPALPCYIREILLRGLTGGESHPLDFPITCLLTSPQGLRSNGWNQNRDVSEACVGMHHCFTSSQIGSSWICFFEGKMFVFQLQAWSWTWSVVAKVLEHLSPTKTKKHEQNNCQGLEKWWQFEERLIFQATFTSVSSHHISLKTSAQLPIYRGRPWATKISLGGKQVEPVVLAIHERLWCFLLQQGNTQDILFVGRNPARVDM